ncbi:MAG TPA: SUMF1/EgtB/PvdO family nonheme iron enzyme [Pyrinomonadaceae bacterium]
MRYTRALPVSLLLALASLTLSAILPPRSTAKSNAPAALNPSPAAPTSRVALVVGNRDYPGRDALKNPVNDARLMSETLRGLGFEVLEGFDLKRDQMEQSFNQFKQRLQPGGVALFFYSGHGIQVGGRNYLVPIDVSRLCSSTTPEKALWDVGAALSEPAQRSILTIVVLDSCRTFTDLTGCIPNAGIGFTEFKNPPAGSFVAFATSPGRPAADGRGSNSYYTAALANNLRMRPSRLEDVFIRTQIEVERQTVDVRFSESERGPQVPWTNSSLKAIFYFTPDEVALKAPPKAQPPVAAPDGRPLTFTVPQVNERGTVVGEKPGRARGYVTSLGGVPLEMVEIPGGRFKMGAGAAEVARAYAEAKAEGVSIEDDEFLNITSEMPQHAVDVPGFFMSKYEITQGQYAAVMGELPNIPPSLRGENMPVVGVTWHKANEFCARLRNLTGRVYRLPSEAEWEYAARAGTETAFAFGPTITPTLAVYDSALPFGAAPRGPRRRAATEVGLLSPANAFGLHDMHGNVWEWVADYWHLDYDGAPTNGGVWDEPALIPADEDDPQGEEMEDESRVARGGSWSSAATRCRSASRYRYAPYTVSPMVGFRVATR